MSTGNQFSKKVFSKQTVNHFSVQVYCQLVLVQVCTGNQFSVQVYCQLVLCTIILLTCMNDIWHNLKYLSSLQDLLKCLFLLKIISPGECQEQSYSGSGGEVRGDWDFRYLAVLGLSLAEMSWVLWCGGALLFHNSIDHFSSENNKVLVWFRFSYISLLNWDYFNERSK